MNRPRRLSSNGASGQLGLDAFLEVRRRASLHVAPTWPNHGAMVTVPLFGASGSPWVAATIAAGEGVRTTSYELTSEAIDYAGFVVVGALVQTVARMVPPTAAANNPPVADAGADQVDPLGLDATLDGAGSSDIDGDILRYTWYFFDANTGVTLNGPPGSPGSTSITADFTMGAHVVRWGAVLVVSDGTDEDIDSTYVTISGPKNPLAPPLAAAAAVATARVYDEVTLDGSGSDAGLVYKWIMAKPTASSATIDNSTSRSTSFTPDVAGRYRFILAVTSGDWVTFSNVATVTVSEAATGLLMQATVDNLRVGGGLDTIYGAVPYSLIQRTPRITEETTLTVDGSTFIPCLRYGPELFRDRQVTLEGTAYCFNTLSTTATVWTSAVLVCEVVYDRILDGDVDGVLSPMAEWDEAVWINEATVNRRRAQRAQLRRRAGLPRGPHSAPRRRK